MGARSQLLTPSCSLTPTHSLLLTPTFSLPLAHLHTPTCLCPLLLINQAARKEPQNKEVRKELEALKKMEQKLKQEQKGMFGGIFANK